MEIPYSKVDCSGKELEYVKEVLESGWLTTASRAQELERRFRDLIGCKHALAVNSCTSALHLALDACGVTTNDKVLVPSLTFTATAEVVRYLGADPVLMDVDYETGCVTPDILIDALNTDPTIKAVIVVHFAGYPIEMNNAERTGIADICKRRGVRLISDAAHALPARRNGEYVGNAGDATCFSFYANKTMTTGEGGLIATNDAEIAARASLMRLHGIDRDVWDRFTKKGGAWEYDVLAPGFKYNMPDLNAAVGLAQFERLDDMRAARQKCAEYYLSELSSVVDLDLFGRNISAEDHAWHLFPIVVRPGSNVSRNSLIDQLKSLGIGTSVHYKPIHRLSYYRERYGFAEANYPSTERIWKGCVSLPIYSGLLQIELEHVVRSVKKCLA